MMMLMLMMRYLMYDNLILIIMTDVNIDIYNMYSIIMRCDMILWFMMMRMMIIMTMLRLNIPILTSPGF
jgi:hypothetical protein